MKSKSVWASRTAAAGALVPLCAALCFLLLGCARAPLAPPGTPAVECPAAPPVPAGASLRVREGKDIEIDLKDTFILNGVDFGPSPTLAAFEAVLGKPDRADEKKANRIHVYDRFGITLYEPFNGMVIGADIYFAPDRLGRVPSFAPKEMYQGKVEFFSHPLDGTVASATLLGIPGIAYSKPVGVYSYNLPKTYQVKYNLVLETKGDMYRPRGDVEFLGRVSLVAVGFERCLPPPRGRVGSTG
jgi:hypothetical protein